MKFNKKIPGPADYTPFEIQNLLGMSKAEIMKMAAKRLHAQQLKRAQEAHHQDDKGESTDQNKNDHDDKKKTGESAYQTPSPFEYTVPSTFTPGKKGFTMGVRLPDPKGTPSLI